jgi:sugar phosphate isomerase/epimerase
VLTNAAQNGYQAIELRGILDEMDLPKCPEFSSPESIRTSRQKLADKGVRVINLGSSANLHFADSKKRTDQLDHAKRFIDLAAKLDCPFVRVFPNDLPADQDRAKTIDLITSGLSELGDYARNTPVSVLLESHGKVIESGLLRQIMTNANRPNVALIWDVVNMWSVTKEPPAVVYAALKPFIRHIHLKDGKLVGDKVQYTLLGEGEAPLTEAIEALRKGGYEGYYSFEWEKRWHPEIQDPEVAIPHYAKAIQRYF